MSAREQNARLNRLLINIGKSLLQYVGEAWPWTSSSDAAIQSKLEELVAQQKASSAALCELLLDREWNVDFGTYPTEYTDLQYLAFSYLLSQLVANQEAIIGDLAAAIPLSDDAEVKVTLERVLTNEREVLAVLRDLAAPKPVGSAA